MKRRLFSYLIIMLLLVSCGVPGGKSGEENVSHWELTTPDGKPARRVAIDTMELSNPYVVYERKSDKYYMTGDGGYMWLSDDLREWNGPYNVLDAGNAVWYTADCVVTAPEIHKYNGRYYYLAAFERVCADGTRLSCELLVADNITGPYVPVNGKESLFGSEESPEYPTFFTDELNAGYIVYSEANESGGALKIMRLNDKLHARMGEPYTMFVGAEGAKDILEKETRVEAPCIFITDTGAGGMLFTAHNFEQSAVAVAYTTNQMGHWLNGPWVAEQQPLIANAASASLFTDYDGTLVMTLNKDTIVSGKEIRVPRFVKMEPQFEKLRTIGYYVF